MSNSMFAAIYIGSYEMSLKIFEFSQRKGPKEIDYIRSRMELGKELFDRRSIGYEMVDEICLVLNEFKEIINGYRIENYRVCAPSVFRNAENLLFVLDQIHLRTGMTVQILRNSEQRFLSYKAIAGRDTFRKLSESATALVDMGGSSVQVTLFRENELITTQRMDIGTLRLRELLERPGITQHHYEQELEEYINKKIEVFHALYLKEAVDSIIFVSDYGMQLLAGFEKDRTKQKEILKTEKFSRYINKLLELPLEEITAELNLAEEKDPLIIPAMLLMRQLLEHLGAGNLWFPGIDISDGMAYDYAQQNQLVRISRDFDEDILSASRYLCSHYDGFSEHIKALYDSATMIFDASRKVHGLDRRSRLLLQVATILHDCGKYVSFNNSSQCAYRIIMSSEIMGLSHLERKTVAMTVLYSKEKLPDYESLSTEIDRDTYLLVAKLSAIFRVANALDQSHRQKFRNPRITIKDRKMVISVEALEDLSLEQMLFAGQTRSFEEIFSIKPVLKEKRIYKTGR